MIHTTPRTFKVFAGDDGLALPAIALGAMGLISVASNEIPGQMAAMVNAALANDWPAARMILRRYSRLMEATFMEASPTPVKAVLAMMGRMEETVRLPMVPVSGATRRSLERVAGELGLLVDAPPSGEDLHMF